MEKIVFGVEHYAKPTPLRIKNIYRVELLITTIWIMVVEPRLPFLSEHVRYFINTLLGVSGGILYHVLQFYGVRDVPLPGLQGSLPQAAPNFIGPVAGQTASSPVNPIPVDANRLGVVGEVEWGVPVRGVVDAPNQALDLPAEVDPSTTGAAEVPIVDPQDDVS